MADLPPEFVARFAAMEARLQDVETQNQQLRDHSAMLTAQLGGGKGKGGGAPPGINTTVDTRLIGKPKNFSGRDEDWVNFATVTRAYFSAISPAIPIRIRIAEAGYRERALEHADLLHHHDAGGGQSAG